MANQESEVKNKHECYYLIVQLQITFQYHAILNINKLTINITYFSSKASCQESRANGHI